MEIFVCELVLNFVHMQVMQCTDPLINRLK